MIVPVTEENIALAAEVHAVSWRASHRSFCSAEFVAAHTSARQETYLRQKLAHGSRLYLLIENVPLGIVCVTGDLIEDLYVLPAQQNHGYGTLLLHHAVVRCSGTPRLWILENNKGAERLYRREGFCPTGRRNESGKLAEIEFALAGKPK